MSDSKGDSPIQVYRSLMKARVMELEKLSMSRYRDGFRSGNFKMTTYEIESDSNDVFQKKLDTIKAELSVIKLVRTTTRNHNKYGDFEFGEKRHSSKDACVLLGKIFYKGIPIGTFAYDNFVTNRPKYTILMENDVGMAVLEKFKEVFKGHYASDISPKSLLSGWEFSCFDPKRAVTKDGFYPKKIR